MKRRPYQLKAVERLWAYWEKNAGNALIVLPTGTGKSVVLADIANAIESGGGRVIVATHVKELVAQNYAEYMGLYPEADAGVYSAGLNRRQSGRKTTFAGIQSVYNKAEEFQKIDVVLVDEAHTIPHGSEGRWHRFFSDLRVINPYLKVVGLTATDYRLKSGKLTKGEGKLFDMIVYEYNVLDAVKEGYLCEISNEDVETHIDASGVGTRGGEYIESQLQDVVDVDDITKPCVKEIIEHGKDRGSWLIFCAGVKHAEHVRDELLRNGISCETVSGETPPGERTRILSEFKSGSLRAVTNNNVLTTGFNHPGCDLIAVLRPTKSPGLWVQILGRGMRLATGKENCMVLDFTNNTSSFGVIDKITVETKKKEGEGAAPMKVCPECFAPCFAGCRHCPDCGHEFPPNELDVSKKASKDALLSSQLTVQTAVVTSVNYYRHRGKEGKKDSLRVDYVCGFNMHSEWVTLEHSYSARERACEWWANRSKLSDKRAPNTIDEALDRTGELKIAKKIFYKKSGNYTEITGVEF